MGKINGILVGNQVIAFVEGKQRVKEVNSLEEQNKVLQMLANSSDDDVDEILNFFERELTPEEESLEEIKKEYVNEIQKKQDIFDLIKSIKEEEHDFLKVEGTSVYVEGINISLPERLIEEFAKDNSPEREEALLAFWSLCALNPDPRARHDLFGFLDNHNLTLTPSGFFVAYRTVVAKNINNAELEKFVTQQFLKVTKTWKKAARNYEVWLDTDEDYVLLSKDKGLDEGELIGNLAEIHENLGDFIGNTYTDAHTRSMTIKIGEPVSIDRNNVDPDPTNSCSVGLHVGNLNFMKANMGWFGNIGIICLINPKDVTSVPEYDQGKMRTCKYLPISIAELDDEGHIVDVAEGEVNMFDWEYAALSHEEVLDIEGLSGKELEEYKKNEFFAPELDMNSITNILSMRSLTVDKAFELMKKRNVDLYES